MAPINGLGLATALAPNWAIATTTTGSLGLESWFHSIVVLAFNPPSELQRDAEASQYEIIPLGWRVETIG
ncbi:hypothetical protein FRC18_001241 [Serendipita sp. 400]|nr:hypothetical protein FRC18_001241 [Serendipita sp. 400]